MLRYSTVRGEYPASYAMDHMLLRAEDTCRAYEYRIPLEKIEKECEGYLRRSKRSADKRGYPTISIALAKKHIIYWVHAYAKAHPQATCEVTVKNIEALPAFSADTDISISYLENNDLIINSFSSRDSSILLALAAGDTDEELMHEYSLSSSQLRRLKKKLQTKLHTLLEE